MTPATLLYFDDETAAAMRLAAAHGPALRAMPVARHRFPDDEMKLRLPVDDHGRLPGDVVVYRSLDRPNEKLVELMLLSQAAREFGARSLILVAPYLAYMRQDKAFEAGEIVSQKAIGRFLADRFDGVITVDPHLHRIRTLDEAIPLRHAVSLSAAPLLGELIARHHEEPLLIGPDMESAQWIEAAAAAHGFEHGVCTKVRHGDRHVEIQLPDLPVEGRAVVLLDDVASSGHTLAEAAKRLRHAGAASVDVAVTHALFSADALPLIRSAGVRYVWSTDCIAHETNAVALAPVLAQALKQVLDPAQGRATDSMA